MVKANLYETVTNAAKAGKGIGKAETISLEALDGRLIAAAASSHMRIKTVCECEPDLCFQATVNANLLTSTLSRMPAEEVYLQMQEQGLVISCEFAQVTLPVIEFVEVETDGDFAEPMDVKDLVSGVNQVSHALGNPVFNPMIGAVHLDIYEDGGFQAVALDGYRFSMRNTAEKGTAQRASINVYGRELEIAIKLLGNEEIRVSLSRNGNSVRLERDGLVIILGLIEGEYFNLDRIRVKNFPIHVKADRDELINALELAQLVSRMALVDITPNGVIIAGENQLGHTEMKVNAEVRGVEDTFKTAFNSGYLMDALKAIQDSEITMHFRSPTTQMTATDGETAIETVLPIRRA